MNSIQSYILHNPETYKEFFDSAHDLIHIVAPDGSIIYVNNSWKNLLGYSPEDIQERSIYSLIHKDDRDRFTRYRDEIINGFDRRQEIGIRLLTVNGHTLYVEGFVSAKYEDGRAIYTSGIFRDITARVKNEMQLRSIDAELKESEANFEQLLSNAPDGVIVIDIHSRIRYWNPKAEEIFGWSSAEVMGESLANLIIPEKHREAHESGMKRFLETGEARVLNRTIEITAINRLKKEFYVSLTISTTYQEGQLAFIAFIRDIDSQKQTEKELEEKRSALEASNEELEKFAYVASHDMKEPVRKIRMFVERLRSEIPAGLVPKIENYIEKIDSAAVRLLDIVDGVLAYSSLKSERSLCDTVDLNQVVNSVQADLDFIFEAKDAVMKMDHLPTIEGSPFLLYQLFYNLINNALKFSRPGVSPVIEVTAKRIEGSRIEITLGDNGIGFSQQYAEMIFHTFARLNSKSQFEGTGLGLSICKSIVDKHHGSIKAYGEENSGAVFVISLPERQGDRIGNSTRADLSD